MKNKKLLLAVFATFFVLSGCQNKPKENSPAPEASQTTKNETKVLVSNLASEESLQKTYELLQSVGIPTENAKVYCEHIRQFNEIPGMKDLLDEYKEIPATESNFDESTVQTLWENTYADFPGYNCRISVFSLISPFVEVASSESNISGLPLDLSALKIDDSALVNEGDLEKFSRIFSILTPKDGLNQAEMEAFAQKWYKEKGIVFQREDLGFIAVYVHTRYSETENELAIGHVGLSFEKDGQPYFIEKLSFQAPYRLIKLDSMEQLKNYLLERYENFTSETGIRPFVLKNGKAF